MENLYKTKIPSSHAAKLEELRAKRNFDAQKWVDKKCNDLNEYLEKSGLKGCVINVSGGIDSSVTYALCVRASKLPNSPIKEVVGVLQPIHSTPGIQNRALHLESLGGQLITVDQTTIFDSIKAEVSKALPEIEPSAFALGNLRSYMRTPVAFYVAQLLCEEETPAAVVGTGNFDEDGFLFYFSKAGDGVSDIELIHDLHKREVFLVGAALGLCDELLNAVPSADLWPGETDEDEIGYNYDAIELYVVLRESGEIDNFKASLSAEDVTYFEAMAKRLEGIHQRNKHKAKFPLNV